MGLACAWQPLYSGGVGAVGRIVGNSGMDTDFMSADAAEIAPGAAPLLGQLRHRRFLWAGCLTSELGGSSAVMFMAAWAAFGRHVSLGSGISLMSTVKQTSNVAALVGGDCRPGLDAARRVNPSRPPPLAGSRALPHARVHYPAGLATPWIYTDQAARVATRAACWRC